jgi:hypothetical protein
MAPAPPLPVTEDTPPDMLAGSMDLRVVLPNGKTVKMSVERRFVKNKFIIRWSFSRQGLVPQTMPHLSTKSCFDFNEATERGPMPQSLALKPSGCSYLIKITTSTAKMRK